MTEKKGGRETGPTPRMKEKLTAKERYDARTAVHVSLKLNKGTDADVLRRLEEVPSKQGYIKDLIREDIAKDEK